MDKNLSRLRRAKKARAKMHELGATRLVVYRTPRHIYAQVIDNNGNVVVCASTLEKELAKQVKLVNVQLLRMLPLFLSIVQVSSIMVV